MKKTTVRKQRRIQVPKKCFFCEEQKNPKYDDVEVLRRYVSERGKILGRMRTGICAKHQRRLTTGIKHARHLALIPFVGQR